MVLVDTPPDLGFLMTTALIAADWYLIPVFPSGYDLRGLEALLHTAQKVRERYNPGLRLLGVLLGNADARARLDADIRPELARRFGPGVVFGTVIGRSVRHREATLSGLTVLEHAGGQQATMQFLALADEVVGRLGRVAEGAAGAGAEEPGEEGVGTEEMAHG